MARNRFNAAPANSMPQIVIRNGSVQVPDKDWRGSVAMPSLCLCQTLVFSII